MRIALVEIVGGLIEDISATPDEDNQSNSRKQLNGLYELLLERTLDLSVFVRARVLGVLAKLCDLPQKFPKLRLGITTIAVACLEDGSSLVRKPAIVLLEKLVATHPYGEIHGGPLKLAEFEGEYDKTLEQLEKLQREIKKAVEGERDDEEKEDKEDDAEGEEEGDGEEAPPQRKKRHHKRQRGEDEMDVDDENEDGEGGEDDEEGEEDDEDEDGGDEQGEDGDTEPGDVEMADGEAQPKKKKSKRRKSEINVDGLNDAAVVQALQGDELNHLNLKRRYYSEALNFIHQVEVGIKLVESLLASKSKAEVLEAMEFFRIMYDYQLEGAEVSLVCRLWPRVNHSHSPGSSACCISSGKRTIRPHLRMAKSSKAFAPG